MDGLQSPCHAPNLSATSRRHDAIGDGTQVVGEVVVKLVEVRAQSRRVRTRAQRFLDDATGYRELGHRREPKVRVRGRGRLDRKGSLDDERTLFPAT